MGVEQLKQSLPNLHSVGLSEKELFSEPKKQVLETKIDEAEQKTKDRLNDHVLNADTLEALAEVETILKESGYGDEFTELIEFRRAELNNVITSFDNYLFHPHSVGKIMSGLPKPLSPPQQKMFDDYSNRKKGVGRALNENQLATWGELYKRVNAKPVLSPGAKTELDKIFWRATTGRSKSIQGKQLDKGILCEDETIKLYEDVKGGVFVKNKERKQNEFFDGECDNSQGKIRDTKTSWEFETFPANDKEIHNKIYKWQLDAYMDLWGLKESELIYGLVDTPFNMITDEIYKLDRKLDVLTHEGNIREEKIDVVVELILSHIYTRKGLIEFCKQSVNIKLKWFKGKFIEIPKSKRLKIYNHKYCPIRNGQLKAMIVLARAYLNSLL